MATTVAMTFNFFVNNVLTYRDKRLKGLSQTLKGLLSFYAVCSIGALSNVGVASVLFEQELFMVALGDRWDFGWRGVELRAYLQLHLAEIVESQLTLLRKR